MKNLEKAIELARKHDKMFGIRNREEYCVSACQEMAEWKDKQIAEAKELLQLCYNSILGITSLDPPEEIAKARKSHNSSLIERIELFMYKNQSL